MTLLKHKPSKTTQSATAIAPSQQQPDSHATQSALYATRSHCKQPGGLHWWHLHCGFTQKAFMGLYSIPERNKLLAIFSSRTTRVTACEFWAAVEQVMTLPAAYWLEVAA